MKATDVIIGLGRPVAFYPGLKKITKSTTASILLCQFIYWLEKQDDPEGWIYKTSKDIEKETGLTYLEQVTARKVLIKLGFIKEKYKRIEHQMYFKVMVDEINEKWRTKDNYVPEHGIATFGNGASPRSLNSNTETTTETTIDLSTASSPTDSTFASSPEGNSSDLILEEPAVEESPEPVNTYPDEIREFVAAFCDCWHITPPPRQSRQGAYWLKAARELKAACGPLGAGAVRDYYASYRKLARPYSVATPGSIVNMLRAWAGEHSMFMGEVPGLWVGG
jgi:hypothetical protein